MCRDDRYYIETRSRSIETASTTSAAAEAAGPTCWPNLKDLVGQSSVKRGGYGHAIGPIRLRRGVQLLAEKIQADPRNFIAPPHPGTFNGASLNVKVSSTPVGGSQALCASAQGAWVSPGGSPCRLRRFTGW